MNILLIVASGKSSRFGGFPKAFCQIGEITNAENTIEKSREIIDKVYIGVNRTVYTQFHDRINGCEMFSIKTGQGDAHSMLKCINYIKSKEKHVDKLLACWGYAVFASAKPFKEILKADGKVNVACSQDENPYAWFDIDENHYIVKSHFAKEEGPISLGMHDQSIFSFDLDFAIDYLDSYRKSLGIPEENDEAKSDINEMKLLYSFEYLQQNGEPASCIEITKNQVLSFNTQEELEKIKFRL